MTVERTVGVRYQVVGNGKMNKLNQYMEEGKTFVTAKELPTFEKVLKEQNESYLVVEMHANRFLVKKDIPEAE